MPAFLITYHGAAPMPPSEEAREQMMSAFMAWAGSVGDNMMDPGSPLGQSRVVTAAGETDGKATGEVSGYTVIKADSMEDAVKAVRSHPFLGRGGTLQVAEAVAP
jgi:hypothetical protein